MKLIQSKMITAIKENGLPPNETGIPTGNLTGCERSAMFIFEWVSEVNEIITNLNIVIYDLKRLPQIKPPFQVSPRDRLYLVIRTYFSEFFRFRECFADFLHGLKLAKILNKEEKNWYLNSFNTIFKNVIKLRNTMTHAQANWTGEDHLMLSLVESNYQFGNKLIGNATGECIDYTKAIGRVRENYIPIMIAEGNDASRILDQMTQGFAQILFEQMSSGNPNTESTEP